MKIALYIIIGLLILFVGGGFAAYKFVTNVPSLEIADNATDDEKIAALDSWLALLNEKKKLNGGVLLVKDGETKLMKAYGYVDHTKQEELTPQSSFRLASLSKQFTCTGIMLLQQKGLLNYDDLVSLHLSGFPYDSVTVRHLMNHNSGIPDSYMSLAPEHRDEIGDILTIEEVVNLVKKYPGSKVAKPGDAHAYNNTGYVLLAGIIEKISGVSFEQFLQNELFDPLGMRNTRVWNLVSADTTFPNKTSSFSLIGNIDLSPDFLDGIAGDGAVFSSLEDFVIWDQFWYDSDLLTDANRLEAFKKPIMNDGSISHYAFGWGVDDKGIAMQHTGSWLGARTYIGRNTEKKNLLVVLDNGLNQNINKIVQEITKAF